MKKLGFIISILISSIFCASAQNEGNIWYFGENAGLDFNNGVPVPLGDGQLNTYEGCATISDDNGDLLFYTDGMVVYNKNHTIMPNGSGLLGHNSSTQSSIIVKKPGSTTIYYIFTVDGIIVSSGGLNYSEVDMTLDGGLGDVTANKNILLIPFTCEKVTAIKHQNSSDFWIISPENNTNIIHSFLLTSAGINMTPILTTAQSPVDGVGYLKGSPDGSRIVLVNSNLLNFELYNFDNTTGGLTFQLQCAGNGPYGAEFSPNSSLLYISEWPGAGVWQFDLLAGSNTSIINSALNLGTSGGTGGALQLAPDNKIYQAVGGVWGAGVTTLPVINNPDIVGIGSDFNVTGVDLGGKASMYGLPTFYSSIFNSTTIFSFNNPCFGDSAFFNFTNTSPDSVLWDFGDPNSGTSNSSSIINPFHIFSDTGTFHINLYSYLNGITDTVTNDLFVIATPVLNLGNDTVMCEGEIVTLDATAQNATYLWQDNSVNSNYTISVVGEYFVEATIDGCSASDTINVIYNPLPNSIISGNYEVCDGDQIFIDVIVTGTSPFEITYTDGVETNIVSGNNPIIIEASQAGIYTITNVVDQFGCIGNYSGSAEVIINTCSLTVFIPNSFTPNNDLNNQGFIPSIYDIDDVVTFNMKIFNRWGDIIYETNEKDKYWDGKFNNTIVQQGVYTYTIIITDIFEELYNFKGSLYLIR